LQASSSPRPADPGTRYDHGQQLGPETCRFHGESANSQRIGSADHVVSIFPLIGARTHRRDLLATNLVTPVKPIYPPDAKALRIEDAVVLEVDIGTDGRGADTGVIAGHPLLVQAATDAVRQWVYKPVILDGQAVAAVSAVTLNFAFQQ
jgi:TonB family protein